VKAAAGGPAAAWHPVESFRARAVVGAPPAGGPCTESVSSTSSRGAAGPDGKGVPPRLRRSPRWAGWPRPRGSVRGACRR